MLFVLCTERSAFRDHCGYSPDPTGPEKNSRLRDKMIINNIKFRDKQMREMGHKFTEGRRGTLISQHNQIS